MPKPRLLLLAVLVLGVSATSCPRYVYVRHLYRLPAALPVGFTLPDSVDDGTTSLIRRSPAGWPECGARAIYRLGTLSAGETITQRDGIYVRFAIERNGLEVLVPYLPASEVGTDAQAAIIARLTVMGSGLGDSLAAAARNEIGNAPAMKAWCKANP